MPITTGRLHLRPLTAADLPALWRLHSDARTFHLDSTPPLDAVDQMERVLAVWLACARRDGIGYMLITAADPSGDVLGVAGLSGMDVGSERVANLYVRLHPHAWGRGVAQEALRAQLNRLSMLQGTDEGPVGLRSAHDAVIITAVQNTPMRTLAHRLGFHPTADQDPTAGFEHVLFRKPLRPLTETDHGR